MSMKRTTAAQLRKMNPETFVRACVCRQGPKLNRGGYTEDEIISPYKTTVADALKTYLDTRAGRVGVFMMIEKLEA